MSSTCAWSVNTHWPVPLHVFRAEVYFLSDLICWLKGFAMLQTLSHINVSPMCGMSDQTLSLNYGEGSSPQVIEDAIIHCRILRCFSTKKIHNRVMKQPLIH